MDQEFEYPEYYLQGKFILQYFMQMRVSIALNNFIQNHGYPENLLPPIVFSSHPTLGTDLHDAHQVMLKLQKLLIKKRKGSIKIQQTKIKLALNIAVGELKQFTSNRGFKRLEKDEQQVYKLIEFTSQVLYEYFSRIITKHFMTGFIVIAKS